MNMPISRKPRDTERSGSKHEAGYAPIAVVWLGMVVGEEGRVDVKESWECWESSEVERERDMVVWMEWERKKRCEIESETNGRALRKERPICFTLPAPTAAQTVSQLHSGHAADAQPPARLMSHLPP